MNPERAIMTLKNESYALGNHGFAVDTLRANRIVIVDTTMKMTADGPAWSVKSVTFADDNEFQEMSLYRRAEPEFAAGIFWARSPFQAWAHVVGTPGEKTTFKAQVPPSALLAVIHYKGTTPAEFIVDPSRITIR